MSESTNRIEREGRKLRWVPLGTMRISPVAQRDLKQSRVDYLAGTLNVEEIGNPEVNHRHHDDCDSYYSGCPVYIMDGQHRIAALREWLGEGWEDQRIQCWVTEGLDEQEEAETFLRLADTLNVTAFDRFQIAITANRPVECDIQRQVLHENLVISRDEVPGAIAAVGTLKRVYERSDAATLGRALRIIRDAYGDAGLQSKVIDGVGHLCQRYNGTLEEEQAIEKLAKTRGGVHGLLQKAETLHLQTGQPKTHCVAAAAVEIINSGRGGNKLQSWFKVSD